MEVSRLCVEAGGDEFFHVEWRRGREQLMRGDLATFQGPESFHGMAGATVVGEVPHCLPARIASNGVPE